MKKNNKEFELFKIEFEYIATYIMKIVDMSYGFFKQGVYLLFILNGFAIIESLKKIDNVKIIYYFIASIIINIILCFITSLIYNATITNNLNFFNHFNSLKSKNIDYLLFQKKYKIMKIKIISFNCIIGVFVGISIILFIIGVYKLSNYLI